MSARAANDQRLDQLKARLMATGAHSISDIATRHAMTGAAAAAWVEDLAARHMLLMVEWNNDTYVPSFLLDDACEPVPGWQPIIEALTAQGVSGWAAWIWLGTPSAWLDDNIPIEVFDHDLDLVLSAVSGRAAAHSA